MDFHEYLHLFQWIFILHIPVTYGFPHNLLTIRPDPSNILKVSLSQIATSKSPVPYVIHKDVINSKMLPKNYQQPGKQNDATLENVVKYHKNRDVGETANSVSQTLQLGNKQGIDSYLRYLPRNLDKYSSHSKKKGTQKLGTGAILDADTGKHTAYVSDSKTTILDKDHNKDKHSGNTNSGQFSEKYEQNGNNKGDFKHIKRILNSKDDFKKPNVIVNKSKDGINFAVMPAVSATGDYKVNNMILAIGVAIVVLGMGIVIGIFGCCCKKKKEKTEKDKEEQSAIINTAEEMDKGLPDARLDLSDADKEEEEPMSIKDKIKAFENEKNKLIIPPPVDVTPQGRIKNSEAFTALEGKQLFIGMTRPTTALIREDIDKSKEDSKGDSVESKTEELSKSDTHEEVSDIPLDNISTHSSITQPHNPDVVIASDDEDEFAEIQRGTVILKSFQRAKPPRNRSPATRSNRKLRPKSPAHLARSDRDSPIPSLMSTSLYVDSTSEKLESSKDKSGSVPGNLDRLEPVNISKSAGSANSEIQKQSKSNGGSSSEVDKSRDFPNGARYKKNKDSPLTKPKYRKKDKESPIANDSRKRISLSELENKKKGLPSAIESDKNKSEDKSKTEEKVTEVTENSVKRLSGLPANVNNIFYLIDPTVKDKCKSAGDVTASNNHSKGKSKDVAYRKDKASKHKTSRDNGTKVEDDVSPKKRERTLSDPARQSREMENTSL